MKNRKITISATFTAEPLSDPLTFWLNQLKLPFEIEFSPFNQVFQQLLDPTSLFAQDQNVINVILMRVEDLTCEPSQKLMIASSGNRANAEKNIQDFILALSSARERIKTPILLFLCPPSLQVLADEKTKDFLDQMEKRLVLSIEPFRDISIISSAQILQAYPVADYEDAYLYDISQIPYNDLFFAGLATLIARKSYQLNSAPYKAIIVDCDDTLWKGICGEDGALGVELDPPRKLFQEFLVGQYKRGMLLCICSKNNNDDVLDVFRYRPEMSLKLHHFVATRINWKPKSENIRELATELGQSLDSFMFFDNDAIECAEVRANCPEVLTIQLPGQEEMMERFVNHIWALDSRSVTDEDKNRTMLYKENLHRDEFRNASMSFEDFLQGLDLKVEFGQLGTSHFSRVVQLFQRVNQFNVTNIRHSKVELEGMCRDANYVGLVVSVRDRFGDYGIVGVILLEKRTDAIFVESFLLSCRALGRHLEHRMMIRIAEIAEQCGLKYVDIHYFRTHKNEPALNFLLELDNRSKELVDDKQVFRFSAQSIHGLAKPQARISNPTKEVQEPRLHSDPVLSNNPEYLVPNSDLMGRIATELSEVENIVSLVRSWSRKTRPKMDAILTLASTPIEKIIAEIWTEVLGVEQVGIHDDFLWLGGHSLQATQILSRIRKAFQKEFSLSQFFEQPTIQALANSIELYQLELAETEDLAELLKEVENLPEEEARLLLLNRAEAKTDPPEEPQEDSLS